MAALIVVTTELALPLWPFCACRPKVAAALSIDEDVTGRLGAGAALPPSCFKKGASIILSAY